MASLRPVVGLLSLGSELLRLRVLQLAWLVFGSQYLWPSSATSLVLLIAGLLLTVLQSLSTRANSDRNPKLTSDQRTLVAVNAVWLASVVYLYFLGLQHAGVLLTTFLAFADHFLLLAWDMLRGNKTGRPFGSSRGTNRRRQAMTVGLIAVSLLVFWGAVQPASAPALSAARLESVSADPGAADSPLVREFIQREQERSRRARQLNSLAVGAEDGEAASAAQGGASESSGSSGAHYGSLMVLVAVASNLARELWVRRRALRVFTQHHQHRGRSGLSSGRKRLHGLSSLLAGILTLPVLLANLVASSFGTSTEFAAAAAAATQQQQTEAGDPNSFGTAALAIVGLAVFEFVIPAYVGPKLSEFLDSPTSGLCGRDGSAVKGKHQSGPAALTSSGAVQPPSLFHSLAGSGAKWYVLGLLLIQLWLGSLLDTAASVFSAWGASPESATGNVALEHGVSDREPWSVGLLGGAVCLAFALARLFPGGVSAGLGDGGSLPAYADDRGLVYSHSSTSSSSLLLSSSAKYLQSTLEHGSGWTSELWLIWKHISASKETLRIFVFLSINFLFMFVELGYGIWTNSLGLISDAGHMMFDCVALAIGLYASYISRKRVNAVYTFGYGRYEVLSGFANGVFLLFIGFFVLVEGIERIFEPPEIFSESLILVSVLGFLVNLVGLVFFHDHAGHGHSHGDDGGHHGHSHGSNMNVSGIFLHVLADALGSVGVITSSVLIYYFEWFMADAICSIFISLLIIASVIPLVRQSASILLQQTPSGMEASVMQCLESLQNDFPADVLDLSSWQCWALVDGKNVLTLQLRVSSSANDQRILARCNTLFRDRLHIDQLCVQIEPVRDYSHQESSSGGVDGLHHRGGVASH